MNRLFIPFIVSVSLMLGCESTYYYSSDQWNLETLNYIQDSCECGVNMKIHVLDKYEKYGYRDSLLLNEAFREILHENNSLIVIERYSLGRGVYTGNLWSERNGWYSMIFDIGSSKIILSKEEGDDDPEYTEGCKVDKNACDYFQSGTIYTKITLGNTQNLEYKTLQVLQYGWDP